MRFRLNIIEQRSGMKLLRFVALLLLPVSSVLAQAVSETPALQVVKKQWYMEVNNPAFEKSPFGAVEELQQLNQNKRTTRRQNEIRARRGLPPLRTPTSAPPAPDNSNPDSPNVYTYKVKFKNEGSKAIRVVVWDYVFFEPGTEREVGRIQFESRVKLRPGETDSLSISTIYPPSDSINVNQTGKKFRDQYSDLIVIQRIEYEDATLWTAPSTSVEN